MVPGSGLSISLKRVEVPIAPNAQPPCLFHQDIRKTKVGGACESPKQAIANVRAGAAALLLLSQRLHEELSGRLDRHPFLKICLHDEAHPLPFTLGFEVHNQKRRVFNLDEGLLDRCHEEVFFVLRDAKAPQTASPSLGA